MLMLHVVLRLPVPQDPGLTLHEILASLPLDPASLFGLLLLLGFFGVVGWFGTHSGSRRKTISPEEAEAQAEPSPSQASTKRNPARK